MVGRSTFWFCRLAEDNVASVILFSTKYPCPLCRQERLLGLPPCGYRKLIIDLSCLGWVGAPFYMHHEPKTTRRSTQTLSMLSAFNQLLQWPYSSPGGISSALLLVPFQNSWEVLDRSYFDFGVLCAHRSHSHPQPILVYVVMSSRCMCVLGTATCHNRGSPSTGGQPEDCTPSGAARLYPSPTNVT